MASSASTPAGKPQSALAAVTDDWASTSERQMTVSEVPPPKAVDPRGTEAPPLVGSASEALDRRLGPRLALIGSDVLALVACEVAALFVVHQLGAEAIRSALLANVLLSIPLFFAALIAFLANGLYSKRPGQVLKNSFTEFRDIVYALGIAGVAALGIDHLAGSLEKQATLEPATIVVTLLFAAILIPAGRALTRRVLRAVSVEQIRVLIVGTGTMARHLTRYLSWDPRILVVGCVDDDPVPGASVLGTMNDLADLCDAYKIDQVMISFSRTHPADAIRRLQSLNHRVAISMVPRYFELITWRSHVREVAGLALIDVAPAHLDLGSRIVKRSFDLVVGVLSLLIGAPLLIGSAIAIKLSSPGPVLFRQERIGRDGKPFVMYKLRTMRLNAEEARSELEHKNEMGAVLFKIRDDPRMTPVGSFLRRTSIDELPQLFNVLRGDMALVGPRPFISSESDAINGSAVRRFEVRPGVTGLWQVSGRSHLTFEELQRLDYLYVASWSFSWDLRILWNTPAQVLRGHGAF